MDNNGIIRRQDFRRFHGISIAYSDFYGKFADMLPIMVARNYGKRLSVPTKSVDTDSYVFSFLHNLTAKERMTAAHSNHE